MNWKTYGQSPTTPCSRSLDMRHWTDGGTAVTNFSPRLTPIYEAALVEWGDDGLVICSVGMPGYGQGHIRRDMSSLHDLKGGRCLSPFWRIFERLRDSGENANMEAPPRKTPNQEQC